MARTTEKSIATKLKRWADLLQRQREIEAARDRELQPLKEEYERACTPIVGAAEAQLRPLQDKAAALALEIENALLAGAKPDGTIALPQVVVDNAMAIVTSTPTREIPAQKFFNAFPVNQRDARFWSCLKVLLGESTKLIGADTVEQLATKTYAHKVKLSTK